MSAPIAVYEERARCVVAIARNARALGCRIGFGVDPSEPEWPVLFIELPTGQVSWHFSNRDRETLASDIHDETARPFVFDGHTTEQKYERLDAWGRALSVSVHFPSRNFVP